MDERRINIDEFFRREMDNRADAPPPAVWEALEQRLDQPIPGRKKPFPGWWFWTIAGLIFLSATGIIAGYMNNKEPNNKTAEQLNAPTITHTQTTTSSNKTANTTVLNAPTQTKDIVENKKEPSATAIANNTDIAITQRTQENTTEHTLEPIQTAHTTEQTIPQVAIPTKRISGNTVQSLTVSTPAPINTSQQATTGLSTTTVPPAPRNRMDIETITPTTKTETFEIAIADNNKETVLLPDAVIPIENQPEETLFTTEQPAGSTSTISELLSSSLPMPIAELAQENNNTSLLPINGLQQLQQADANAKAPVIVSTETVQVDVNNPTPGTASTRLDTAATASNMQEQSTASTEEAPEIKEDKPRKPIHLPIEAGIKFGYSSGFDQEWKANKFVFAPYIEYRLPGNFSILFQPSYQTGNPKTGTFENSQTSYYELTDSSFNSNTRVVRGLIDSSILTPNPPDTVFRTYAYSQTYDSVSVSYGVTQQRLWDIELPLMLKYRINNTFSIMAGASATYSSVLQTGENVQRFAGLKQEYNEVIDPETFFVTQQGQQPPEGPGPKAYNELFSYNTTPFSGYQPRPIATTRNFFRYGFMIGASASLKDRLMLEMLFHKSGVDATAVPDKQLQKLYTQPYLRFTVGYKLFK